MTALTIGELNAAARHLSEEAAAQRGDRPYEPVGAEPPDWLDGLTVIDE